MTFWASASISAVATVTFAFRSRLILTRSLLQNGFVSRSAYDVLLAAAGRRDFLPLKRKEGNAKDRLLNDFLHHIEENGMGSSSSGVVDGRRGQLRHCRNKC